MRAIWFVTTFLFVACSPCPGALPPCPSLACDSRGSGFHYCVGDTPNGQGILFSHSDGRACATNPAVTVRCLPTSSCPDDAWDFSQDPGAVELMALCDECPDPKVGNP